MSTFLQNHRLRASSLFNVNFSSQATSSIQRICVDAWTTGRDVRVWARNICTGRLPESTNYRIYLWKLLAQARVIRCVTSRAHLYGMKCTASCSRLTRRSHFAVAFTSDSRVQIWRCSQCHFFDDPKLVHLEGLEAVFRCFLSSASSAIFPNITWGCNSKSKEAPR